MKNLITILLLTLTLSIGISTTVAADTIYSTFGPGDSYNSTFSWVIGDSGFGNQSIAAPLSPSTDAFLGSIEVAGLSINGVPEFTFDLTSDLTGSPGSLMESFTFSGVPSSHGILYQDSVLNPLLSGGSQYWLIATTDIGNHLGWNFNDIGLIGFQYSQAGSAWDYFGDMTPAFRLNSAPIPEPSTFLLLGGGLAGLAFVARRRKKE